MTGRPTPAEIEDYAIGYGKPYFGMHSTNYYQHNIGPDRFYFQLTDIEGVLAIALFSDCVVLDKYIFDGRKRRKFEYHKYDNVRELMFDVLGYVQDASKRHKKTIISPGVTLTDIMSVQPMTYDEDRSKILAEF